MMKAMVRTTFDAGGVVGDIGNGDWQRRIVTLDDVAQRIADQHGFNAGAVEQTGKAGVVAGEHDDLFASLVELGKIGLGQAAGSDLCRHGFMCGTRNRRRLGYTEQPINSQA
jgi:hypothetical protein